jgi:hypothetical protein
MGDQASEDQNHKLNQRGKTTMAIAVPFAHPAQA